MQKDIIQFETPEINSLSYTGGFMRLRITKERIIGLLVFLTVPFSTEALFAPILTHEELVNRFRVKIAEGFRPGDHHLELRDLGFEHADLIPADESAITSLVETPDGDIFGGTTGYVSHLFVYSYRPGRVKKLSNWVRHLGKIPGHESIHHSLVCDDDGIIYFGTGLNELTQHPISFPQPGNAGIMKSLWADIEGRYADYEGGRLFRFDYAAEKREWIGPHDECGAEDLGIPVPHDGIYALTINKKRKEIYGITYPRGHFFVYQIEKKKFIDKGSVYKQLVYPGPNNRTLRGITATLVCDDKSFVYGSGDAGRLFRYDPESGQIEVTDIKIPAVYYSVTEAFAKDENGLIYGGTNEGYLFRFDPEKLKLTNLGKPFVQMRIRALTVGKNGCIYGIGGERPKHCRMFRFDPKESHYDDLGILKAIREPYYNWTGLQFDSMVTGKDGIIYVGESERRSHLFIYYP